MLVTMTSSAPKRRNELSLSSASTTNRPDPVHRDPVPSWFTTPPTMNDGFQPTASATNTAMADVVVLPWVPEIANVRCPMAMASIMSGRVATVSPAASAVSSSMLPGFTAVDTATTSAPRTWSPRCPVHMVRPSARRRSRAAESTWSEPVTVWPMAARM